MASASPTEFDYTFTDKELQEILGFMEHQAGGQDAAVTAAPPPFLSAPAQSGLALQFQPHAVPVQSGSTLSAHPYDQSSGVGMKAEPSSGSTGYGHAYAGVNGVSMSRGHTGPRQNSFAPASSSQLAPDRRTSLQQIQGSTAPKLDRGQMRKTFATIACEASFARVVFATEPKQHISHSTVEKQRRDRINSLIDEVGTCASACRSINMYCHAMSSGLFVLNEAL